MNQTKKKTFLVLFGGASSEYEVSLSSAYGVITNADRSLYDILTLGITKEGTWYLYKGAPEKIRDDSWREDFPNLCPAGLLPGSLLYVGGDTPSTVPIDVAFPVMHGAYGEDGRMQGLLEMCGIPFVGPDCAASGASMDKAVTKRILEDVGIPQAKAVVLHRDVMDGDLSAVYHRIEQTLGYPVFVKPARAGSSVGISKVNSPEKLKAALEKAFREDGKLLVEEMIVGKETEVAVMGNDELLASLPGEIDPGADFYDYDTKYKTDTASYYIPARIPEESAALVREYAKIIFRTLGCRGLSRVDFFVRQDGSVIFNEINTLPGFTPISMYPKLMMQTGMTYTSVINRLLALAVEASGKWNR